MEYSDFIGDFATRTLKNLDHLQAQADAGHDVFPVTQLWNSLLGLVVLPRERDLRRIPRVPMAELWAVGWPRLTLAGPEPDTLHDLVSSLRRAVAHFNVEFHGDANREIASVTMWTMDSDSRGRAIPGSRRWEGRLQVSELDRLARLIAALYLRELASRAA